MARASLYQAQVSRVILLSGEGAIAYPEPFDRDRIGIPRAKCKRKSAVQHDNRAETHDFGSQSRDHEAAGTGNPYMIRAKVQERRR